MGNFLKTMTVVLVLCASVFAQEIDLNVQTQQNPQLVPDAQERFERFTRMRKVGTGLIIGGATLGTTAIVMSSVNLVKALDYEGWYFDPIEARHAQDQIDKYEGRAIAWLLVGYLGYTGMTAGIPLRIVGRVKANQWQARIPTAYITPNGAQFVWNF